jgi:hypothetical protein
VLFKCASTFLNVLRRRGSGQPVRRARLRQTSRKQQDPGFRHLGLSNYHQLTPRVTAWLHRNCRMTRKRSFPWLISPANSLRRGNLGVCAAPRMFSSKKAGANAPAFESSYESGTFKEMQFKRLRSDYWRRRKIASRPAATPKRAIELGSGTTSLRKWYSMAPAYCVNVTHPGMSVVSGR